ncbi:MAG: alpha/beta fold hydrolase [Nitriliruptoraceae bacterium]
MRTAPREVWDVVPGGRLPLLEVGTPGTRTLVLLPGLTDGLAPVTEARAHALYADVPLPLERMRGLILSYRERVRPGTSTRCLAADLAVVLERRLDAPAVLVAHSLGGMVAQHLAADHPELVAGLVLSATSARADARLRTVLARWDRWLAAGEQDRFRRDAIRASVTGRARHDHLALDAAARVPAAAAQLVARHLVLSAACAGHDASERLDAIEAPSMVLAGGRDELIDPAAARQLAGRLPRACFVGFDDLGHGFPEQARGPFQAHVSRFLAGLGW